MQVLVDRRPTTADAVPAHAHGREGKLFGSSYLTSSFSQLYYNLVFGALGFFERNM